MQKIHEREVDHHGNPLPGQSVTELDNFSHQPTHPSKRQLVPPQRTVKTHSAQLIHSESGSRSSQDAITVEKVAALS
ncbi:hypothetical protein N7532_010117 [Penicillium argentinense]|uniref:Uncharacterized protein n=1 Tax=Penicillium argentinense TaxID=1131581 RepID=A0A9W9EP97_9EURO|nr:uncharacterized protein N7532_010117 [Penicillium argentinense]KAJ5085346.1 hypothetical protein N7532_010117 [Penicillium argentinense]